MSASCSIEPLSLRSESTGPLPDHELQIVHDNERERSLTSGVQAAGQPPDFGPHLHEGNSGGVVDPDGRARHLRDPAHQLGPILRPDVAAPQVLRTYPCDLAYEALNELLLAHLQRKDSHRQPI